VLLVDYPAVNIHRSLAGLTSLVRDRNVRGLVLVTFNYDDVLQRAFDHAGEPYDVVSYVANGEDRRRFLHHRGEEESIVVSRGNEYVGLPIDEDGEVERTVIVRLLGGIDRAERRRDGYVVSRRHEIDFATHLDFR
jgi:glutaredoxin-related protein